MANIKVSELNEIVNISSNDFIVVVDSGSVMQTFRTSLSAFNTWFQNSGSALSASWVSRSFTAVTTSFNPSASYAINAGVGLFLYYNGTDNNGTVWWAITSSYARTGSVIDRANSSFLANTASFVQLAKTASNVVSSSFSQVTKNTITASTTNYTKHAQTASYINLDLAQGIPLWYGPFTSSAHSGSPWSWTDPLFQGVPIMVLNDGTNVLFDITVKISGRGDNREGGYFSINTIEARFRNITSSAGDYIFPRSPYTESLDSSEDYVPLMPCLNDVNRLVADSVKLYFRKTLNRGNHILWIENKGYRVDSPEDSNAQEIEVPLESGMFRESFPDVLVDTALPNETPDHSLHQWIQYTSGSVRTLIYADKEVQQGIMFASTSSVSNNNLIGGRHAGRFGRVYAFPFLVNSQSLSLGFCSASFMYMSGSNVLSASHSASASIPTTGLSLGDVAVAFMDGLPAVANRWTTSVVVSGIPLSPVPIRTNESCSFVIIGNP